MAGEVRTAQRGSRVTKDTTFAVLGRWRIPATACSATLQATIDDQQVHQMSKLAGHGNSQNVTLVVLGPFSHMLEYFRLPQPVLPADMRDQDM